MKCRATKQNGGFTLVELIVTMAVAAILLAGLGVAFGLGMRLIGTAQSKFNEHSAALAVENAIKNKVQLANRLVIYSDPSQLSAVGGDGLSNSVYFGTYPYAAGSTADNRGLVVGSSSATTVLMQGQFKGYGCSVTYSKVSDTALGVTIVITKNSTDSYTLKQTIPLRNIGMDTSGASIGGQSSGTLIGFNVYTVELK